MVIMMDTVIKNFRCSLTEMSVLLDVLNLVKEKQYLVADPVSQDTPDTRPATQLLAKKKVSFMCGHLEKAP